VFGTGTRTSVNLANTAYQIRLLGSCIVRELGINDYHSAYSGLSERERNFTDISGGLDDGSILIPSKKSFTIIRHSTFFPEARILDCSHCFSLH
jgi:hypothetical protein